MSRRSRIFSDPSDLKELRRITKNYNAKIEREKKKLLDQGKVFQAASLPQRKSVRNMKGRKKQQGTIKTRKDYDKQIAEMENYITTGNRYIIDKNTDRMIHATVRDFNTQVDKLRKNYKGRAAIPEKISREKLLRDATSKKQLKKNLKDYQKFYKDKESQKLLDVPDNKHNIKVTKWQDDLMKERKTGIDARREEQKQKFLDTEVKYMGKKAGYSQRRYKEEMYEDRFNPLNLYNYSMDHAGLREKLNLIMRESNEDYYNARTELARLNYIGKLEQIFGDSEIGKHIIKKVKSLSTDEFYRELKGDDDLFALLYEADKDPDRMSQIYEQIWSEWFPDKPLEDFIESLADRME